MEWMKGESVMRMLTILNVINWKRKLLDARNKIDNDKHPIFCAIRHCLLLLLLNFWYVFFLFEDVQSNEGICVAIDTLPEIKFNSFAFHLIWNWYFQLEKNQACTWTRLHHNNFNLFFFPVQQRDSLLKFYMKYTIYRYITIVGENNWSENHRALHFVSVEFGAGHHLFWA